MKCKISDCGNRISTGRAALGLRTCLTHGQQAAAAETAQKFMRVALLSNKGNYAYLTKGVDLSKIGSRK